MSVKRKASSDMATVAPKKRRTIEDNHWPEGDETAEGTTTTGLKLLESLRRSQDKTGRLVATEFLQLPPSTNHEYYQRIKLPLSFQEIQDKLDARQYGDMTALESDLKRMVQNAKEFNVTGSKVYEDAERIRKALSNFMPKHNPAYKDQDYRAQPTPVPDDDDDDDEDEESLALPTSNSSAGPPTPATIKLRVNGSASRKNESGMGSEAPVAGKENMQEEQLKIVEEIIELRDPDDPDTEITLEFYEKPSRRDYPDYYKQIAHPTALKDIQKAVSSNKFPTWEVFITEVEYLWENARKYNEEDSFIHENANKLRDWFLNRLSGIEGARDIMPPKKLILNPPKNPSQQPTPRIKFTNVNKDIPQPGITVDEEARRRQDEHVRAASRGQAFRSTETPVRLPQQGPSGRESPHAGAASRRSASVASLGAIDAREMPQRDRNMEDVPPDVGEPHAPSENQRSLQEMATAASMQPPPVVPQQAQPVQLAHPQPARQPYPVTTAFDRIMRDAGKGLDHALYKRIEVETNPDLRHPHPWFMTFFPEAAQTQHGAIVHLPPSHFWHHLTLWLSEECLNRAQYRPVVSRDLVTLYPEQPDVRGVFEYHFKLHPGVNTICVDVLANINKRGEPAPEWPAERHDFERFVLTVDLLAQEI